MIFTLFVRLQSLTWAWVPHSLAQPIISLSPPASPIIGQLQRQKVPHLRDILNVFVWGCTQKHLQTTVQTHAVGSNTLVCRNNTLFSANQVVLFFSLSPTRSIWTALASIVNMSAVLIWTFQLQIYNSDFTTLCTAAKLYHALLALQGAFQFIWPFLLFVFT